MKRLANNSFTILALVLGFIFFGIQTSFSQEKCPEEILNKPVKWLFENNSVGQILENVSFKAKIQIGFEELPTERGERQKVFTLGTFNGTVKEILDKVTILDSRYVWTIDNGVINVLPRKNPYSILNIRVSRFSLVNVDADAVGLELVEVSEVKSVLNVLKLKASKSFEYDGPYIDRPVFSIDFADITVLEILNEVIRKSYSRTWTIERYGENNQYVSVRF